MFSHFLRKLGALAGRTTGETVSAGGLLWRLAPEAAAFFGPAGPDLAAWQAAGLTETIKQNLQRTIARARLPGGTVYIKRCRANTPRSWAREVLRPAKAQLEFENALTLRARGVAAIEPLAWGSASRLWPGESYLITRAEEDAIPFLDFLETPLPPAQRRQVADRFAAFLAALHEAGVTHPDPHPGNVLIARDTLRFVLADLHAVRFGPPLGWPATCANLTLLNRWFQVRGTRADRLRFWRAYAQARRSLPIDTAHLAKELEQATAVSNNRFWAARAARYVADNRDSKRVRARNVVGYAVRDFPPDVLSGWLADPDALFAAPGVRLLKDSRTSTVAELALPAASGPRAVIVKRFNLKTRPAALKNLFRPSPALRSWLVGNGVRDRGLPTARPLAVFHRTALGVPLTGYAVCEKVPDALELSEAIAVLNDHRTRRAWAERLGRLVRLMHERQVSHRDLKAPNILMRGATADLPSAEPVLIDLVGVEAGRPVRPRIRVRDLARLNASFLHSPHVTRADRLRFLRAYLCWGLHGRGDWKPLWRQVADATRAKAAKNARSGRPLA